MIQDKIELTKDVYLVGKIDDRNVPFHRLNLAKGTTYNSYYIDTENPTIIDTVDISFGKEYVDGLKKHLDLSVIKYIVINHVEPDHSGGLPALASQAKNAIIVCTELAAEELKKLYGLYNREFRIVTDGDVLDLGGKTLKFFETPYLHTEETMSTYLVEDKILFSCDIFSTHLANFEYFNDAAGIDIDEDFALYYRLIMHPHRRHVAEMLQKIETLPIGMIAPSHGYIIRENADKYIAIYEEMSRPTEVSKKAVVLYSSMTGTTKKMSILFQQNFEENGIPAEVIDMNKAEEKSVLKSVEEADLVLIGTSTKYADMTGNTEGLVQQIVEMNLEGKIGGAFGSFGWSGEGTEVLQDYLLKSNMDVLTTTNIIKTTGVDNVHFPLRMRSLPEDERRRIVGRAANFVSGILLNAN